MGRQTLEELVTSVAYRLMAVNSDSLVPVSEEALRELVEYFNVEFSYLRHNDHEIGATVLVAEWPHRAHIPDPDPLGVVYFRGADPIFAACESMSEELIVRPEPASDGYQRRVLEASGIEGVSTAIVPLRSGDTTTGVIGFIKFGDRNWTPAEINALKAIAALMAQLQARVIAEDRLRYYADHDALTGLSNRRALMVRIEQRLSASHSGPTAVLYLDLDRLKALNDFLGHVAGDHFIQALAKRLLLWSGPDDIVARLGGDEFVIVLAEPTDATAAEAVAHELQALVGKHVQLGQERVSRSASIGVAIGAPGKSSGSDLLRQADQAVLSAKARGGDGIVVFTDEMRARSEMRSDIELHLRSAIHDDSLILHYQPEISLQTGEVIGAEALVRWVHPTLGLLQPGVFIEVAEATNLAGELGRWVIKTACRQLATWQSEIPDLRLCLGVNVSPVQLVSIDFVDSVAEALSENEIDGPSLCMEITEHAVLNDLVRTRVTLQGLQDIGVQVAIDDFGTGYSSLAHLKALPVNTLKIDRGFVRDLGVSSNDLAIVKSIISLATSFGLGVIAEGVETEIAARTLIELGCLNAQGYLFSRPIPADQMGELLRKGKIEIGFDKFTKSVGSPEPRLQLNLNRVDRRPRR